MSNNSIDLAALDTVAAAEEGAELELSHPATNQPLGVYLTLVGTDSSAWRQAVARNLDRRQDRRQKSPEQLLSENVNIYADCTLGWRNVTLDGEALPFSRENARKLYRRFPWIREQVDAFMGDRANFLRA